MSRLIRTLLEEFRIRLELDQVERDLELPGIANKIDVVVGMRRSGKTYFLFQQIRRLLAQGTALEAILYLNFEDDRLLPLDSDRASQLVDAFYALFPENHDRLCHLFLDEVHQIENWALWVRRLHDTRRIRLYLTGSSAKLLGREIATELRGRALTTEVWPYSFTELLRAKGMSMERSLLGRASLDKLLKLLHGYLAGGGFPEVAQLDAWQRTRILQDYVDVVVFRDVVERHRITNVSVARYLTQVLLRSIGRSFSVNKVFNDLKSQGRRVSKTTLYDYIGHFEDAYLCFAVPLHDRSPRRAETAPRKIYAVDPGLAAAFTPAPDQDLGQLFENLVFLDLRRRGCDVTYYLTRSRYEVDFVARHPTGQIELVQACYEPRDARTLERETRALREAELELGLEGTLVTPESYLEQLFTS
jgi:predicted AAA+ superfamily ATPase